ncbi:TPA: regulatory protein RecX [Legionella pneumophila]
MTMMISTAIKLLSERNCSERDLRRRLEKECADLPELDQCIESTIVRLRELHLINDNRLAESLAQRYIHKGNRFITQALLQKGVGEEVIAAALVNLGDEYSRALDEARKKLGRKNARSPAEIKASLYRFLSGRGFSHDTIKAVVRQLCDA